VYPNNATGDVNSRPLRKEAPAQRASEDSMMSRFWILTLTATLCLSSVPAARAVSGCTNDLLNGGFSLPYPGSVSVTAGKLIGGLAAPANAPTSGNVSVNGIARFNLTLDGAISGYSWGNVQGAWVQDSTLTGSFTVNTDCTVNINLKDASGA